jgi:hypothetical protein
VWLVLCIGVFGAAWRLGVRYVLHLIKCGHIAVLTELVTFGEVRSGSMDMFAYGKHVVSSRFGEVNVLFAVDALVTGVVRSVNGALNLVARLLPLPGLGPLFKLMNAVLFAATTYIDESIFSYGLARGDHNPWASAKDGLIYYAQNSQEVLKTGVWIVVLDKVLTVFIWVLMLLPAFVVGALLPQAMAATGFWVVAAIAALLAGSARAAFLQPLFLVMVMLKFHLLIRGQSIDEAWDERLTQLSNQFRGLTDKIAGYRPVPGARA